MALKQKKIDIILLVAVLALVFFGLGMISLAGAVMSKIKFGDEYHLFKRQLFFGLIPGLVAMFCAIKIKYTFWKKMATPFFFFSVICLVLTLFPHLWGMELKGAKSWIKLGNVASFQPIEVVKLALIVYLAKWLESRSDKIKSFQETLVPFLTILTFLALIIILQPDIGGLGIIGLIGLSMFFLAGAPFFYILSLIGGGLSLLMILIQTSAYRKERFLSFLSNNSDLQGSGYQISQALIAFGSGGVLGLGLGQSRQKFNYLPEPVGDSIYAIIGEEFGLAGTLVLIMVFIIFLIRGLKIAKGAPSQFAYLLSGGIAIWIVAQAFVNIMAILGLMPLTGVTLPFVSYGSSSVVFSLLAVGILLNISSYSKK